MAAAASSTAYGASAIVNVSYAGETIWRGREMAPNGYSWVAILLHHRGLDWLMEQRSLHQGGVFAGRTGTRVAAGFVATRWHDGVRYADGSLWRQQ